MDRIYQTLDTNDYDYDYDHESIDLHADTYHDQEAITQTLPMTQYDLRLEEDEIHALEQKKRALEERVTGMEKDIGRLMR